HGKRSVGITAESLPVKKVAPAAHDLSHQKSHAHRIEHERRLLLSHLRKNEKDQDRRRHTADNTKTSMPDIDDIQKIILVVIPGKNHIVGSRPDNSGDHHADQVIQINLRILSGPLRFSLCHKKPHQKACGNDDPVKHNRKSPDGNVPSHMVQYDPEMGKSNIHIFHSALLNHAFSSACLLFLIVSLSGDTACSPHN